jgi:hypothetical protein
MAIREPLSHDAVAIEYGLADLVVLHRLGIAVRAEKKFSPKRPHPGAREAREACRIKRHQHWRRLRKPKSLLASLCA